MIVIEMIFNHLFLSVLYEPHHYDRRFGVLYVKLLCGFPLYVMML